MDDTSKLIGYTTSGRPVFAIAGGDGTGDDGDAGSDDAGDGGAGDAGTGDEGGTAGDAGEKDWEQEAKKWRALSRKHESQAKQNADAARRLKEAEDADKTELQKLTEAQASANKRAAEAESRALRYEVALEKNIPSKLMKFLGGTTSEEIQASADELLEAIKPDTGETGTAGGGKPREKLRSGAASSAEPEEGDPREIAAKIPRDRF